MRKLVFIVAFAAFGFIASEASAVTVLTTTGSEAEAEAIAEALLADELAACVQIIEIRSRYIWNGAVRHEPEQLLLINVSRHSIDRMNLAEGSALQIGLPADCMRLLA